MDILANFLYIIVMSIISFVNVYFFKIYSKYQIRVYFCAILTIFRFLPLICKLIGVTKLGLHHSIVQTFAIPMTYTVLSKPFKTLTNFMHETDIFSHEEMSRHSRLIFLNLQEPAPGHVTKPAMASHTEKSYIRHNVYKRK